MNLQSAISTARLMWRTGMIDKEECGRNAKKLCLFNPDEKLFIITHDAGGWPRRVDAIGLDFEYGDGSKSKSQSDLDSSRTDWSVGIYDPNNPAEIIGM